MKHSIAAKLSDALAQRLERAILERRYKPGEALPPERSFAAQLGVSRATLREAVGQLVERGLLVRRQGAGTFVSGQIDEHMADPWVQMLRRHPLLQGDLLEFREMLEMRSAELAAQRATEEDRALLRERYAAVEQAYATPDRAAQVRADVAFHRAIADATRNPVFSYLIASLMKLLQEHVQISISDLPHDSQQARALTRQHRALLDAILRQDAARARRAAQSHLGFVKLRLNEQLRLRRQP
ncbi:FadR/GntR family transcriptional regulator [Caldimonas tepidiphila]|uniref:FadR/GntR family transcriptional regulator n=1 Tax=Caldimonas tepidiphila TaxID=2315841 RepID=UPI0023509D80|nr:FCD domain-containing protein [Caldimonas tepidiphila]